MTVERPSRADLAIVHAIGVLWGAGKYFGGGWQGQTQVNPDVADDKTDEKVWPHFRTVFRTTLSFLEDEIRADIDKLKKLERTAGHADYLIRLERCTGDFPDQLNQEAAPSEDWSAVVERCEVALKGLLSLREETAETLKEATENALEATPELERQLADLTKTKDDLAAQLGDLTAKRDELAAEKGNLEAANRKLEGEKGNLGWKIMAGFALGAVVMFLIFVVLGELAAGSWFKGGSPDSLFRPDCNSLCPTEAPTETPTPTPTETSTHTPTETPRSTPTSTRNAAIVPKNG